jgi:GNAT superfamily N-acetyltransferase
MVRSRSEHAVIVPTVAFRLAQREDVPALLHLLPDLSPDPEEVRADLPALDRGYAIFDQMQRHGNVHIVLACLPATAAIIGSCMVVVVPNFTYRRPWAIIENVVIAATHQRQGIGAALLAYAFEFAEQQGCYKAQLLSGPDERQIRFYRKVGMDDSHCHGFKKWFIAP